MKKSLMVLVALLLLSPIAPMNALADSRGSLTISATFGNLALHNPSVRQRPAPTVIVVDEVRYDRDNRYEKRGHRHGHDRHKCNLRHETRRHRHQEPTVVYYYPDYRQSRGYRY